MKQIWVDATHYDKAVVTAALEAGAHALLLSPGDTMKVKALGLIPCAAPDGDLRPGKDYDVVEIKGKADEERAAVVSRQRIAVIKPSNWEIIPLENLIAQGGTVFAWVTGTEQAKTALQIMEKGVDGIVLSTSDPAVIQAVCRLVHAGQERFPLVELKITEIKSVGMGDRVCVDTSTNMQPGEGMLAGNTSSGMFLVHAETSENPYVDPRPFRVNAGGVHAYVMVPGGKTKYLADLKAGDQALIVRHGGEAYAAVVGRVKIERRPMLMVSAVHGTAEAALVLQNAETIRLVAPSGKPVSVVELKKGDTVLGHIEKAGRHFGMKVQETILEK